MCARRRGQAGADHAEHDRRHRQVLVAPGVLAEHALAEEHQHEQAGRERRLHDDQRSEQQRDDLQRPAEDRQARCRAASARGAPGASASARRRCSSCGRLAWRPSPAGRSLGCRGWRRRRPRRFPAPDRPCPPTIIASPYRTDRRGDGGALAARPATCCRRSPARWPPLRGRWASRTARPSGRGYALTFDDGPHAQGTPAVLELLAGARRARDVLPRRRAGRGATRRWRARSSPPATRSALHCDRHRNLLRLAPRAGARRTSTARARAIEDATGRSPSSTGRRTGAQRGRAAPRQRARLAHAAVEPLGTRLGGARDAGVDRRARHRGRRRRARCCCCTTPTTTPRRARGGARVAALPRVLETLAERGLRPVAA